MNLRRRLPSAVTSASRARAWRGGVWKIPGYPSKESTRDSLTWPVQVEARGETGVELGSGFGLGLPLTLDVASSAVEAKAEKTLNVRAWLPQSAHAISGYGRGQGSSELGRSTPVPNGAGSSLLSAEVEFS